MNFVSQMLKNIIEEEMKVYNEEWHKVGDVREWEKLGHKVRVYRKIQSERTMEFNQYLCDLLS